MLVRVALAALALCLAVAALGTEAAPKGVFWHLTDIHYDSAYAAGGNINQMCHSTPNTPPDLQASPIGSYLCDSSPLLVESAFDFLLSVEPDPDFIIWTGDDPPHLNNTQFSQESILHAISNVTNFIKQAFPTTPVFASIGNHDSYPQHQIAPGPNWLLSNVTEMWSQMGWLDTSTAATFAHGGYFSTLIAPGLRVVSLNTVFYYHLDMTAVNQSDPAGQFAWLRGTLEAARAAGEKVWVIAHVPPGVVEKVGETNYHLKFNGPYLDAFSGFDDVVVMHLYGHEHSDSFRLYYPTTTATTPTNYMLLTASLTPWYNPAYSSTVPPNNPSLRLFKYDPKTFELLDYVQFYTDLAANLQTGLIEWQLEYIFSQYYAPYADTSGPLSAAVLLDIKNALTANQTAFQEYVKINSVSYAVPLCDASCRAIQLCAIQWASLERYADCIGQIGAAQ